MRTRLFSNTSLYRKGILGILPDDIFVLYSLTDCPSRNLIKGHLCKVKNIPKEVISNKLAIKEKDLWEESS